MKRKRPDQGRQALWRMYLATSLIHVLPLALYERARWAGLLLSEEVWYQGGGNHGPWWDSLEGLCLTIMFIASSCLPFITAFLTVLATLCSKTWRPITFLAGISLVFFQCWAGNALWSRIFWTID